MAADIIKVQVYEGVDWLTVSIYNPTQNLLWYEKITSNTELAIGINQRVSPLQMSFPSSYDRSQFIAALDAAMTTGSGTVVLNNLRTVTTTTTTDPLATTTTTTAGPTTTTTTAPTTTTTTEPTTTTTTEPTTTTTTAGTTTTTTPGPPQVYYRLFNGGTVNAPNENLNIYRYRPSTNNTVTLVSQRKTNTTGYVQIINNAGLIQDGDQIYSTLATVSTAQNSIKVTDGTTVEAFVLQNGTINYAPDTTFSVSQGHSYYIEAFAYPGGQNPYNTSGGGGTGGPA